MLSLTVTERGELKARAHSLNPTVIIGNAGLTEAVMNEIDNSLKKHELIKIKAMAEREQREDIMQKICDTLDAAPVQHIGKTLIIYRPLDEADANNKPTKTKRRKKPLTKKQMAGD